MIKFSIFFLFIHMQAYSDSNFENLNKDQIFSKAVSSSLLQPSLVVVQKRLVPKTNLSEVNFSLSKVIKGALYSYTGSWDLGYRFHFNRYWAVGLKYSKFFNKANREGHIYVKKFKLIPINLRYANKQSLGVSLDFSPFYGKFVFFGRVVQFDLYTSITGGALQFINQDLSPYTRASLGMVFWWNSLINSRWELGQTHHLYPRFQQAARESDFFTDASLSLGVMF